MRGGGSNVVQNCMTSFNEDFEIKIENKTCLMFISTVFLQDASAAGSGSEGNKVI